ncbi:MAG TPA: tetratricopeptide repeat protein [Gammaproteobacteria bacterium]
MTVDLTERLEAMLAQGRDGAPLRLALATRYLEAGDAERAAQHAAVATTLDPDYSAAWKLLGRAHAAAGRTDAAAEAYERGIAAAERRGDRQAAKEMQVFLKRLRRPG